MSDRWRDSRFYGGAPGPDMSSWRERGGASGVSHDNRALNETTAWCGQPSWNVRSAHGGSSYRQVGSSSSSYIPLPARGPTILPQRHDAWRGQGLVRHDVEYPTVYGSQDRLPVQDAGAHQHSASERRYYHSQSPDRLSVPLKQTTLRSPSAVEASMSRRVLALSTREPSPLRQSAIPADDYLALSELPVDDSRPIPKLVVLDLNGALMFRHTGDRKKGTPRPYLDCFLKYLLHSAPDDVTGNNRSRQWTVFVWSSAQPHNVRGMLESTFGNEFLEGVWDQARPEHPPRGDGRLIGVWARDKMGLDNRDYGRKVQTTKDLRKVISHLDAGFDERTTVLIDDSPLKAVHQPWSHIVIPEYDKHAYQTSRAAANSDNGRKTMDRALLAVIGILDTVRNIDNVPAWVRRGGLLRTRLDIAAVEPERLPSHESFTPWYQNSDVLDNWIAAGVAALRHRKIPIHHGIFDQPNLVASPSRSPPSQRSAGSGGWSPSRPSSSSKSLHTMHAARDEVGAAPLHSVHAGPPAGAIASGGDSALSDSLNPMDVAVYLDRVAANAVLMKSSDRHLLQDAAEVVRDMSRLNHERASVQPQRWNASAVSGIHEGSTCAAKPAADDMDDRAPGASATFRKRKASAVSENSATAADPPLTNEAAGDGREPVQSHTGSQRRFVALRERIDDSLADARQLQYACEQYSASLASTDLSEPPGSALASRDVSTKIDRRALLRDNVELLQSRVAAWTGIADAYDDAVKQGIATMEGAPAVSLRKRIARQVSTMAGMSVWVKGLSKLDKTAIRARAAGLAEGNEASGVKAET